MSDALLAAKLQLPRVRAERVARPRLLERLDAGLARPLTLVSAPAGFGKTTLLAEWVARLKRPCAWLSLEERDSDPVRFLTYFIGALEQIESEAGGSTLASLRSPGMAARLSSLLPALLNDIQAIPDPFVLVLDDYHLITGQAVHEALTFLIDHPPEPLHLILSSRADPPLPLARLRASGQLSEIRQKDLCFTPSEAALLLRQTPGLASSDVLALAERTEGWAAGLQMASLALQSLPAAGEAAGFVRTFGGTHRHVADYLVEEVLANQPDDVRRFLLHTSVLDCLTGPLYDAVLGWEGAQAGAGPDTHDPGGHLPAAPAADRPGGRPDRPTRLRRRRLRSSDAAQGGAPAARSRSRRPGRGNRGRWRRELAHPSGHAAGGRRRRRLRFVRAVHWGDLRQQAVALRAMLQSA